MTSSKTGKLGKTVVLLVLGVAVAAGCDPVGKGLPPDSLDLSVRGDLAMAQCTTKNCAGCCAGDVCQQGITAQACGGGGGLCVQCTAAQMCGADLKCAFDPNANWHVSVLSATFMTTNPLNMNKPWRTDGTMPQPFIQYDGLNTTPQVAIVVSGSTWTATWGVGQDYTANALVSTGFDLQAIDQESGMPQTPMSNVHHVTLSQQELLNQNLTYSGWEGVTSITINLQRH